MMDLVELAQQQTAVASGGPLYPMGIPPDVCDLFEKLALLVANGQPDRGIEPFSHYSADAVLHRIRWHYHIERGNRSFKCNDHWTAPLARWFLARHPELPKFFELRERLHDGYRDEDAA